MKKNKIMYAFVFLLLACLMISFTGCSEKGIFVTFMVNGREYERIEMDETNEFIFPKDPIKTGYSFDGWFLTAEGTNEFTGVAKKSITVYAKFSLITYNIKYEDTFDVTNPNVTTYNVESGEITLQDISREGFKFKGWYNGDRQVTTIPARSTGDITLTASWTKNNYIIIYQNTYGAINTNPIVYDAETESITLKNLSRDGYYFDGWYNGDEKVTTIPKGSTGNMTLTAKWTKTFFITYKEDDYVITDDQTITLDMFESRCIDTEGKDIELTYSIIGEIAPGNLISVKISAVNSLEVEPNIIYGIKVYGAPKITSSRDEYISFRDNINSLFSVEDSFGEPLDEVTVEITNGELVANSTISIKVSAIDSMGNDIEKIFTFKVIGDEDVFIASEGVIQGLSEYGKNFENLIIPQYINGIEITEIGNLAFYQCENIVSVVLPSSITNISDQAFNGCTKLSSVTLEDGIINIGSGAFYNCINLKSIDLPNSVRTIGSYAFALAGLESFIVPTELKIISTGTFQNCSSLKHISNLSNITKIDDYAFYNCTNLKSIDLPNSVKTIGSYAFAFTGLESFTFPTELKIISNGTFQNCSSLKGISDLSNITKIGNDAFSNCTRIESVMIPDTVTFVGENAFYGCAVLVICCEASSSNNWNSNWNPFCRVHWETNETNLYSDGILEYVLRSDYAIISKVLSNIKTVEIPETITVNDKIYPVTTIGMRAFVHNYDLVTVMIPKTITSIEFQGFYNCPNLKIYYFEGVNDDWDKDWMVNILSFKTISSVGNYLYSDGKLEYILYFDEFIADVVGASSDLEEIVIPENIIVDDITYTVNTIVRGAFSESTNLKSIIMPNTMINLGERVFSNYTTLESIVLSNSLESIPRYTFSGCTSLKSIIIPNHVRKIDSYAFKDCASLESIIISDVVRTIESYAFQGCTSLKNIIIPDVVRTIEPYAFKDCASLESITISNGVETIEVGTFQGCTSLESIIIPNSVETIESYCFQGCTSLKSIIMAEGVITIEAYCFQGCISLESIIMPDSLKTIESYCFQGCTSLKDVVIPKGVSILNEYTFDNCLSLESVTISKGVTEINDFTFNNCPNLLRLFIPDNNMYIGPKSFDNCDSIVIYFKNSKPYYGWNGTTSGRYIPHYYEVDKKNYYNDGELEYVIQNKKAIVTRGSLDLVNVVIPNTIVFKGVIYEVDGIGDAAFASCTKLKTITLPSGITEIPQNLFSCCTDLRSIIIPDSVINIEDGAFSGCNSLTEVTLGNSVESIGSDAFRYCRSLTSINIPDSVTNIGRDAFSGCNSLTEVTLGNSVESIGSDAFRYCRSLTSINIPDSVIEIGDHAFEACNLNSFFIPKSVTEIGYDILLYNSAVIYCEASSKQENWDDRCFGGVRHIYWAMDRNSIYSDDKFEYLIENDVVTIMNTFITEGAVEIPSQIMFDDKTMDVTVLSASAFSGLNNLSSVRIPSSITTIHRNTFNGCFDLRAIFCEAEEIPNGWDSNFNQTSNDFATVYWGINENNYYNDGQVEYIIKNGEASVIKASVHATTIDIPKQITINNNTYNVTSICKYAFENCTSLLNVTIPNTVTKIERGAFSDCTSLLYIAIPSGVTEIRGYTFSNCTSLLTITIPNSVTSIGEYAFNNCTSLLNVTIPNSVTKIERGAFSDCTSLLYIAIPSSVTEIYGYAFENCTSLLTITIPNSVTSIGDYAFEKCTNLLINCEATTRPVGWYDYWNFNESSFTRISVNWGVSLN